MANVEGGEDATNHQSKNNPSRSDGPAERGGTPQQGKKGITKGQCRVEQGK